MNPSFDIYFCYNDFVDIITWTKNEIKYLTDLMGYWYPTGTIVELSTSNDNDLCEVGVGVARCLVKFGDGTHSWAAVSSLKLLSAPPADDGRIMCVVCKRREGPPPATGPATNAIIACDMCGRGYHAKCHSPPVEAWIHGTSSLILLLL